MTFTFGSGSRPAFGATTTTAATGMFGSTAPSTPATGFTFGTAQNQSGGIGFGSSAPLAPSSTGFATGFGSTSTAAPTLGFGTAAAPSTGFTFGSSGGTTGSANTGFGALGGGGGTTGFGTAATSGTGFGTGLNTGSTQGFGSGFGGGGGTTAGFSVGTAGVAGFGGGIGAGGFAAGSTGGVFGGLGAAVATGFGANTNPSTGASALMGPTATNNVVQPVNITAVLFPVIFNDERDMSIAKWNQLQACWGAGKGFYGLQPGQSVDFTPDSTCCFFKAVGYSCIPQSKNEDGFVSLTFSRAQNEVCDNQQLIVDALHRILGSRSNLMICVEGVKPVAEDRTEMVIYVQDRQVTGLTKRIPAMEVSQFLSQDCVKNHLSAQLCIINVFAKVGMSPDQQRLYLSTPPAGIDGRIWEHAKLDNPNPDRLLPVPMVGFADLYSRLKRNEQEAELHQTVQDMIASDIVMLQNELTNMIAKAEQAKRRQAGLSHSLLKVIIKQEIHRKNGYAIQADEEVLRAHLEALTAELNSPTQLKGRLNELMSQMRMQTLSGVTTRPDVGYHIDPRMQEDVKQHLKRQHESILYLVNTIKEDLDDIKLIEQDLGGIAGKCRR